MKKYLVAFFVTILALASCAKDLDECRIIDDNTIVEATTILTFASERPQLDPTTKTAWDADLINGKGGIVWSTGDKIKIGFTFNGEWWAQSAPYASGNPSPNNRIKFYESGGVAIDPDRHNIGTFTVSTTVTGPTTSGDFVFYAFYPSSASESNNQDDAPNISTMLKSYQTPAADSFDPTTDILVAQSKTITPDAPGLPTETINLYWTRVVAHGNFTLKNFQGVQDGETISKVVFTAQDEANLTGEQVISVADGSFSGKVTSNVVKLDGTNLSFSKDENGKTNLNVWLSVMPVTLTSLDIVVETNKAIYHRSIPSIPDGRKLEGNRRNTMGINMSTADRTPKGQYYWVRRDISHITSNDVFVIVNRLSDGSTYAMANNNGANSAPAAVAVTTTVSGDRLTADPLDKIKWSLSEQSSGYVFYPYGQTTNYLYCSDNNNGLRVGTASRYDSPYFTMRNNYLYNSAQRRFVGVYNNSQWRSYRQDWQGNIPNISNQTVAFYVRVDAASYTDYTITFQSGTTFTEQNTDYYNGGSFVNTCDGLALTLTNINNSGNTEMRAGSYYYPSVATITSNTAIPEAIKTVTLSITQINRNYLNSLKLIVSSTSDFSSTSEYRFTGYIPGDVSATITAPAANMYYKIEIDLTDGNNNGHFRFNRIIYATE